MRSSIVIIVKIAFLLLLSTVVEAGESILDQEPVERTLDGPRLLGQSRAVFNRVVTLGLLYRFDGDRRWADRAIREMRAAAEFSDWNPSHFLDTAEMSAALAFGYDWLCDAMTPDDRAAVETALAEKGLAASLPLYEEPAWWVKDAGSNWNNVCNGGMILGALAIADREPELASEVLSYAVNSLGIVVKCYEPDGGWPEGPVYWDYATTYTLLGVFGLKTALGTDFGLMDGQGVKQTGYFPVYMTGPTGKVFNFADGGTSISPSMCLYALSQWYDDPAYAYLARKSGGGSIFDLIFYNSAGSVRDVASIPRDRLFSGIGVAEFRSSWTDRNALFVGFKAGRNGVHHHHLDLGGFVMEADGVRWADELGGDNYSLPDYFQYGKLLRWQYYRLNTKGHNTLVINGLEQNPKANAPITEFVSREFAAFAVADLTEAYAPSGVESVRRGVKLGGGRRYVLIQDEICSQRPADVVWTMHTQADIAIDSSGGNAVLSLDGKTLNARILSPSGAIFAQEEVRLDPPQYKLENERKLMIRLPECSGGTRIAVLLSRGDSGITTAKVTPLEDWE